MSSSALQRYGDLLQIYFDRFLKRLAADLATVPVSVLAFTIFSICIPPIMVLLRASSEQSEQPQGCRKLGLKSHSNLDKIEGRATVDHLLNAGKGSTTPCTVKSLWIYPVKSCKGVELDRAGLVKIGMQFDRQFTFAQLRSGPVPAGNPLEKDNDAGRKWEFITQRQFPLLATVKTEVWIPSHTVDDHTSDDQDIENRGVLVMSFPYQAPGWAGLAGKWVAALIGAVPEKRFRIPLKPSPAQISKAGYKLEKVTIWKDTIYALNLESELPEELRHYLGVKNDLGLFTVDNNHLREVYRCAPRKEELGWQPVTGFQDAYPLHILNLASVQDVERRMPEMKDRLSLSAERFRANILSPEAYEEDTWKKIRIGSHEYAVACRTARCKLPNVDQNTGEKHRSEPDNTLRKFRNVDAGAGDKTGCLGMQMVPISQESAIRVGDEVTVLETGEHYYIKQ